MSTNAPSPPPVELPASARIAVAAARWNAVVVDALLDGCVGQLTALGLDEARIEIFRVPGAFELPVAAKLLTETKRFDAIILLGCVVRGDTPHFDYVAGEAARGIQGVAIASGVPCLFGVLTVNTQQQALDRCGGAHGHAGVAAANGAAEMIAFARSLKR